VDVDVMTRDQLEEQLHGAAERRRRHDEGHEETLLRRCELASRRIAR
jgi:hypothetical protein